ncbi:shaggy-related protein kinase [Musa troglodytarum]|uniref:Shaggy-related protein kinase n=1 Tax=Musa troglodytarum TaxID=320322 RepID=A0A9E7HBR3_9LILI|nr:shaggy-related protein kinase [Musa troglodytarum]URE27060.1 shaggy-related protein kinase [Musa troglodytarum]
MPMEVTGIPRPTQHLRLMSRPNSITSSRCWHGLRNPKEPHRPEPTPRRSLTGAVFALPAISLLLLCGIRLLLFRSLWAFRGWGCSSRDRVH